MKKSESQPPNELSHRIYSIHNIHAPRLNQPKFRKAVLQKLTKNELLTSPIQKLLTYSRRARRGYDAGYKTSI